MDKDLKNWWHELREEATAWLHARTELTRVQAYEKIAKVVGVASSFFILAFLVGFVVIFVLLMLGSWVAQLTGSVAIGVSSIAVLMIALFIFLLVKRKTVLEKPISNRVIQALFDEDDDTTIKPTESANESK